MYVPLCVLWWVDLGEGGGASAHTPWHHVTMGKGVVPWVLVRGWCVSDKQAAFTFLVGGFFDELGVGWILGVDEGMST